MDDQNKKNDYDDFFKPASDGDDAGSTNRAQDDKHEEESAGKSSYYYSYGPFKPGPEAERGEDGAIEDRQASAPPSPHNVEVTPPTQLRPFAPSQSARGWQPKESRRSPFKAMFASFLVGVVAVGSLMYVSDKQNWFTSEQALSQQSASSASSAVGKAGDSGSVSSAADVVRPNNIAQLFEKSSPAVVKIETFTRQQSRGQQGGAGSFDDFFSQFFGDENGGQGQDNGQGQGGGQDNGSQGTGDLTPEGIGTGFFFDSSGYILTNEHVVDGADEIRVTVQGTSEPYVAKKLGSDYNLDLAVLKVEGKNPFPTLPIGDSNKINIGDWVVAIGNPYGFDHTVTVGVLSAKERPISIPDSQGTREYQHLLQTDASINPGNSGGPLLNLNGEVVGINTAVSSQAQGIGFAIPTSTITEVLDNLKSNTAIPKKPIPFIGATLAPINDALQKELELSNAKGSVVSDIIYKSPAYMADLRQYDVITGLDGKSYDTPDDLIAAIKTKAVGDKAKLNIVRNGQKMDLTVTIGNKNDFEAQTQQQQQEQQNQ
ncbi:trypsin-like peptidase domain-containing protein [Paenibacillus sp. MWE-103]|uniref:Trypsin-like peptidase domain-containing protein n=1 Tax=Paenibacillus artemisiicola TaxID=1172618 RepID=A0ABS3WAE0_9BACL|nr:trypsin-like peptidase domain-containing protein [Paenibacillus artemisiicola]MBO7745253.1 trypsin-like peptidase domain-containing protein [Paenibacillus artemisiicola]